MLSGGEPGTEAQALPTMLPMSPHHLPRVWANHNCPKPDHTALHFLSYPSIDASPATLPAPVKQLQGAQDKDT